MFLNVHTHLHSDTLAIRNIIVGNSAEEHLLQSPSKQVFSVGIHPWYLPKNTEDTLEKTYTLAALSQVLAVGECGLDRLTTKDLSMQTYFLEQQISMAHALNKPLIIHCVRAFSEFLAIRKKLSVDVPIVIHGFNQNPQILAELLKHGCYVSLGAALLNCDAWANKNIKQIPLDRLFLETDHADLPILAIFVAASEQLNITVEELQIQLMANGKKVFGKAFNS